MKTFFLNSRGFLKNFSRIAALLSRSVTIGISRITVVFPLKRKAGLKVAKGFFDTYYIKEDD